MKTWMFGLLVGLMGCQGRQADQVNSDLPQYLDSLGLRAEKPQVIVFGAAWCKPCLSEIDSINTVSAVKANDVQFVGALVEGVERGRLPDGEGLNAFTSPAGSKPRFPMILDARWELYEKVNEAQGHTLPLFVMVGKDGDIKGLLARSARDSAELQQIIEQWLGTTPAIVEEPNKLEPSSDLTELQLVGEWKGHAEAAVYERVQESWKTGLSQFGFSMTMMPLEKGYVTLRKTANGLVPERGNWSTDEGCTLTVWFKDDGRFVNAYGVCA